MFKDLDFKDKIKAVNALVRAEQITKYQSLIEQYELIEDDLLDRFIELFGSKDIKVLNLKLGVTRSLRIKGFSRLKHIALANEAELLRVQGVGRVAIREIHRSMNEYADWNLKRLHY